MRVVNRRGLVISRIGGGDLHVGGTLKDLEQALLVLGVSGIAEA
ncbi:MAG: hypothetical protein ACRDYA_17935 [Egibacteraceae bacterium]